MNKLKCLIIDKNEMSCKALSDYISADNRLEQMACFYNASRAIVFLAKHKKIDLLFVNVELPLISGFDFIKIVKNPPKVIFTGESKEHAMESFNLNAVDYLLKPYPFLRFQQAINKLFPKHHIYDPAHENITSNKPEDFIIIKQNRKLLKIYHESICFLEAYGEYVKIFTSDNRTYMILQSLKSLEEKFYNTSFVRAHRSYIINMSFVESMEGNKVNILHHTLPVSRKMRSYIMDLFLNDNMAQAS
jgi:DNA-binding LytR/AlgR family response regulator